MAFLTNDVTNGTAREHERQAEYDILERLDRMVREAVDHPVNTAWREYAIKAFRYEMGDQLDAEMLAELVRRKQPPIIENRLRPQRKRFMSTYHKLRLRAAFTGRNLPMDEAESNALNDLNRYIDQETGFFTEETLAVKDKFIAGVGWIEKCMEREPNGRPRLISRYEDPFHIWPDPYGRRQDLSDHRYIIRGKWMDLDQAIQMWPDKEKELTNCFHRTSSRTGTYNLIDPPWENYNEQLYVDQKRQRVRPFEVWYRRKAIRKVAITKDGVRVSLDTIGPRKAAAAIKRAGLEVEDAIVDVMYLGVFCGMTLIHHDVSQYQHGDYPFVQYLYERNKDGRPVGWITEDLMSLQDALNKRQSKALHLLNTKQVIYSEDAVEDDNELAEEVAKPDGKIKLRGGRNIQERFQMQTNTEMGQGQLVMYGHNRQAFEEVGQTSDVAQGRAPGEVRSDRGLARLEANAIGLDSEVLERVKAARRQGLLIQTANIQQYYTDDMILQITDDPGMVKVVRLTAQDLAGLRRFHINLAMVEENDYATTRQQQLDMLSQSLPQILQFGAGWASVLIQMTDLRDKEQLLQMVEAMNRPPDPEAKVSLSIGWSELPLNERVMWAMKLGLPEEFIQLMMEGGMPSKTELTVQNDQAKQQSKERMEQGRLQLKAAELGIKQDQGEKQMRLDAMSTAVQEETKREMAEKQANAKAKNESSRPAKK